MLRIKRTASQKVVIGVVFIPEAGVIVLMNLGRDAEQTEARWLVFQGPCVSICPNPNGALHVLIVEEICHCLTTSEGAELLGVVRKAEHPQALQQVRFAGVRGADEQVDPPALQAELPDRFEAFDLHLADHPRAS
jgi:hypothetical protein